MLTDFIKLIRIREIITVDIVKCHKVNTEEVLVVIQLQDRLFVFNLEKIIDVMFFTENR